MQEYLEEMHDKESRRKNVVLFNVPESTKKETEERECEDKEVCEYVFREGLEVREAKIEKVVRMGNPMSNKKRPMIVTLTEERVKWELVKRSKRLKSADDGNLTDLIIGPDMTKKEREENARLREELKNKREQGGSWTIRKGKVVRKDIEGGRIQG